MRRKGPKLGERSLYSKKIFASSATLKMGGGGRHRRGHLEVKSDNIYSMTSVRSLEVIWNQMLVIKDFPLMQ